MAKRTWRSESGGPSSRRGTRFFFTGATALLAALAKAETEGLLAEKLAYFAKPRLLMIDELGYLPFEKRSAHLFFQLVAKRFERGGHAHHD
nr:ATP-binding protein [Vulgatibacter incomptus]